MSDIEANEALCQSCGACCEYSELWPRFSTESRAALRAIPPHLVDRHNHRMRSVEDRCCALRGEVGRQVACSIYDVRPEVCRACQPGDEACNIARQAHGLPPVESEDDDAAL